MKQCIGTLAATAALLIASVAFARQEKSPHINTKEIRLFRMPRQHRRRIKEGPQSPR